MMTNSYFHDYSERKIIILNNHGEELTQLEPITQKHSELATELAKDLSEWRHQFAKFFKTGFPPDPVKTQNWIQNVVIGNPNKILYLVHCRNERMGHFGLTNITASDVELDNAIRARKGGHPDLFRYIEFVLLDFSFRFLKIKRIYGYLFSHNFLAMTLHKQFGFKEVERFNLKLVSSNRSWNYEICSEEESTERFKLVHIELCEPDFDKKLNNKIKWEFK